jgi:hypothetical protein
MNASKPSATREADDTLREATVISATEQFRALLETNYRKIKAAAVDSFAEDENQEEPMAKARFSVEFGALSTSPVVSVRVAWAVAYKDESEEQIDPLQSKLPIAT